LRRTGSGLSGAASRSISRGRERPAVGEEEEASRKTTTEGVRDEKADLPTDLHHRGPGALATTPVAGKEDEQVVEATESTSTGTTVEGIDDGAGQRHSRIAGRRASLDPDRISPMLQYAPSPTSRERPRMLNFVGVGAHPHSTSAYQLPNATGLTNRRNRNDDMDEEPLDHSQFPHYLTRHTTGRNAQFYGLTKAERDHLGGVEYRAISLLAWVVPIYFVLWQFLGCVGLGAYMAHNKASTAEANGINPW